MVSRVQGKSAADGTALKHEGKMESHHDRSGTDL
jgi:hypothetical protein